ncbi:MAG: radical SAM protein [Rhodospirillaceae bacterium]
MKICLIRPPIVVPRYNQTALFTPPLGLAYVAGKLVAGGFDVFVVDALGEAIEARHPVENDCQLFGLNLDQVVVRVPDGIGLIGVSAAFSFEWPICRTLIAKLRARFPEAVLIAGGEHASAVPRECLEQSPLDACVIGEGEESALELAGAVAGERRDWHAIAGLVWRTASGAIEVNDRRVRMRALDDEAWPAWELFPLEAYLDRGFGFGVNRGRSIPVLASRGCPYQCTFCSSPQMWTTRWVARDPQKLIEELAHYQKRYGAENFDFYDLTAIVKKDWIVEFCTSVLDRGMKFTWQLPSGTRSEAIDGEVADLLFRSGCRNLSYSPESGSPAVLARIQKKIHPDRMVESIASCVRHGLNVKCNIMLGFPGETLKEVWESYRFIVRMALAGAHDLSIWAFSPYPGSRLYEELVAAGRIVPDDAFYDKLRSYADTTRTVSFSEHIPDATLKRLRFWGTVLFYVSSWLRRPARPFLIVCNILRGRQESRGEMALAGILQRAGILRRPTS